MKLVLDAPQQMLARTATDFVTKDESIARFRKLRDTRDELGYSPRVWREMADLGWTAIPFAEADGGLGLGMAEVVLITEALGRALAPEPYLSAVVLAGSLLADSSATQKASWLAPTLAGEKRLAVAFQEAHSRYRLAHVETTATANGSGWVLQGEKTQVIDGHGADGWIVAARTAGAVSDAAGVTLFVVPAGRAGVSTERQWRVDARNAAILLDGVAVGADDVIGAVGEGLPALERAVDRATVALCGEMVGGMSEAFDRTVAYLGQREQFGVRIGTFQALKHRAAKMFIERELARSSVMGAARALDAVAGDSARAADSAASDDARIQVSNAKARCSDAYILLTNEALQMHGGIGMTDEHDIGLFMKRARVAEMTFGDAAFHRDRFARLQGY